MVEKLAVTYLCSSGIRLDVMNGRGLIGNNRGVSPIIGVSILIAIAIISGVIVAGTITQFGGEVSDPAPPGSFETSYQASGVGNTDHRPYVNITHELGQTVDADNILIKDESENTVKWSEVWTAGDLVKTGEYVHIDGFQSDGALDPICESGDTYKIIYKNDDGNTLLVYDWVAPTDPSLPSSAKTDSNDDGIPDWCN